MNTHQFDDKKANFKTLIHAIGAKEVDCHVRLTVHSITNIPVLKGAFRVRWKFRDIDSRAAKQQKRELDKARLTAGESSSIGPQSEVHKRPPLNPNTQTSSSSSGVSSSENSSVTSVTVASNAVAFSSNEKGSTPFLNMREKDHTVVIEQTVEVVAHMRIVKGELISEPLKLVVEQWVDDHHGDRKLEPRIGHRYIDLAEYVNEGKVRRKFLLERSKVNAMIAVSLDISVLKPGVEFKKPVLKQDHLIIGRKDVKPPREKPLFPPSDRNRPTLTRTPSSATSSSTSSRSISFRGVSASRTETESVIEALFNPTIFSRPTVSVTPSEGSRSSHSSSASDPSSSPTSRRRSILQVALDLNSDMTSTIRPKLPHINSGSFDWDMVEPHELPNQFHERDPPERSSTMDSMESARTDFSTTSTVSSEVTSSAAGTPPSSFAPPSDTESRGRWYRPFRKTSRRSSTTTREVTPIGNRVSSESTETVGQERQAITPTPTPKQLFETPTTMSPVSI